MSHRKCKRLADVLFVFVLVLGFCRLVDAQQAEPVPPKPDLYSLNTAISKGVVSTRMSLFGATDQKHVLDTIQGLDPGMIYATYVGVWGTIRQQDLNSAEQLAGKLRQLLPHTILGGGVNESMSLSIPPQTLTCGGQLGTRTFAPAAMFDSKQHALGDTAGLISPILPLGIITSAWERS